MLVHNQEHDHGGEQPLKQIQQSNIKRTNGKYPKLSSYAAKANEYLATDYNKIVTREEHLQGLFSYKSS